MLSPVQGAAISSLLTLYSWREQTLLQGQSRRMAGVYQSRQLSLLGALTPISHLTMCAPLALGLIVTHIEISSPNLRDTLRLLSSHAGKVIRMTLLVSSLALGNPALSAAVALPQLLNQIPSLQDALEPYQFPLFLIFSFLSNSLCEKSVACIHLLFKLKALCLPKESPKLDPNDLAPGVNPAHFSESPTPSTTTPHTKLLTQLKNCDKAKLTQKVRESGRLGEEPSHVERLIAWLKGETTSREITFVRDELESLVTASLSPLARSRLALLSDAITDETRAAILLELAEANVCSSGRLSAITEVYNKYVGLSPLEHLQEYRFTLLQAAVIDSLQGNTTIDLQNRHIFHAIMLQCPELALQDMGQASDSVALDPALHSLLNFPGLTKKVLQSYTVENIKAHLEHCRPTTENHNHLIFN